MNVLSLFSGIGGIELGLERAGMTTVGQVELDPWCRQVLRKHWPDVPQHENVLTAAEWWQSEERPDVDVVCGGFPCQPFSDAGFKLGIADERWMWPAMAELVRAVRPSYVLVENVAALVRDPRAFGTVLSDLHAFGFDAEWATLRASDFGAPHRRERVYLLAYTAGDNGGDQDESAATRTFQLEPGRSGWEHGRGNWLSEPQVGRVADGVPRKLVFAPLHALGVLSRDVGYTHGLSTDATDATFGRAVLGVEVFALVGVAGRRTHFIPRVYLESSSTITSVRVFPSSSALR